MRGCRKGAVAREEKPPFVESIPLIDPRQTGFDTSKHGII